VTAPDSGNRPGALRWWRELALVVSFYGLYTYVRNHFGSASTPATEAFANAEKIIHVEQFLHVFNEQALQKALAGPHLLAVVWNSVYASLHFAVTIGVLVFVFRRFPASYRRLRNALAAATALGLVGFALFPLMPPRLFCECPYGAGAAAEASGYGFVDTLVRDGGLWSFGSSGIQAVSNQYAAMPSLHFAWALWCALALLPRVRRSRRPWVVAYPAVTLVAIVVTANHFWLDAVGGALVVALGWWVGAKVTTGADVLRKRVSREDISTVLVERETSGVPWQHHDPRDHHRSRRRQAPVV
jgi:hypothetical protein